jgi:hypothetical protein
VQAQGNCAPRRLAQPPGFGFAFPALSSRPEWLRSRRANIAAQRRDRGLPSTTPKRIDASAAPLWLVSNPISRRRWTAPAAAGFGFAFPALSSRPEWLRSRRANIAAQRRDQGLLSTTPKRIDASAAPLLVGVQSYQPPAMEGTSSTRSPSFSGEDSPLRKRISSSFR